MAYLRFTARGGQPHPITQNDHWRPLKIPTLQGFESIFGKSPLRLQGGTRILEPWEDFQVLPKQREQNEFELPNDQILVPAGHPDARCPNRQNGFPPLFDVPVTAEKFWRQITITRVVDRKCRDDIATLPVFTCRHADVHAIEMKMRKIRIEPQSRGFA